jgi:hypothetical protein
MRKVNKNARHVGCRKGGVRRWPLQIVGFDAKSTLAYKRAAKRRLSSVPVEQRGPVPNETKESPRKRRQKSLFSAAIL